MELEGYSDEPTCSFSLGLVSEPQIVPEEHPIRTPAPNHEDFGPEDLMDSNPETPPKRRCLLPSEAGPKWEDLNKDCLVNVVTRLGMKSLLIVIPFVCKSWYRVSLDPSCWQTINFQEIKYGHQSWYHFSSAYAFFKSIIKRSQGNATTVMLPTLCTEEVLRYLASKCPALKALYFPSAIWDNSSFVLPKLICKWKNLELLKLGNSINMVKILEGISLHCKNFCQLDIDSTAYIGRRAAAAIPTLLPNIKYLNLRRANISRTGLKRILRGCKKLVHLDVRDSVGFECDDKLLKLGSHISNFQIFKDDDAYIVGFIGEVEIYAGFEENASET
nr:F-box/LRR-repeat protein At3g48880-like isoform X1 [Quercus suber]POF02985.1 f-box protein fbw2 [Quercus suber]